MRAMSQGVGFVLKPERLSGLELFCVRGPFLKGDVERLCVKGMSFVLKPERLFEQWPSVKLTDTGLCMALNPERVPLRGSVDPRCALRKKAGEVSLVVSGPKPSSVRTGSDFPAIHVFVD